MTVSYWFAADAWGDDVPPRIRRSHPEVAAAGAFVSRESAVSPAERDVIERVKAGDRTAFDTLAQTHWDALWRYAYRLLYIKDLADDVVQDVLFGLWRRREQLDSARGARGYLFGAVRLRSRELARHHRIVQKAESTYGALTVSGVSDAVRGQGDGDTDQLFEQLLERFLQDLPENRQEILALRWRYGLTYDEIAQIVGLGVSAVKMQVHRAATALRPVIEAELRDS